jgi:dihydroorotate dehydrogenase
MILDWTAPILRSLPAEPAHRLTVRLVKNFAPLLPEPPADDARLAVTAMGLSFPNPIGLAAGFDKDAEIPDAMLKLGFGFVECGTVTPRAQIGNPRPRLFRLVQDRAVINRMGFNNRGMEEAANRLQERRTRGIVGINIGANKDSADRIADYVQAYARLAPLADYVTVNVSSPNTPGLRGLQSKQELTRLLSALTGARAKCAPKPILLKIAPDLDETGLDDIADAVEAAGIEGVIVSNTTVSRPALASRRGHETGGLSGKPLFALSTERLRQMRARLAPRILLVGAGGVASGAEAYEKIQAGASLIQLYTGLVYEGPGLVRRIKQELLACLSRDGFASVTEAVGSRLS